MCLGTIGQVLEILDDGNAIFECFGAKITAAINFVPSVKIGDYCMIHAGAAIAVVDEEEAALSNQIFEELLAVNKD